MQSKATVFEFTSYSFDPAKKRAVFNYKTKFLIKEPLFFTETIILPKIPDLQNIPKELIDKFLQSLHIILGISYYKFYCPTKIKLPYQLSKGETDFWNVIYKKGLGEFFYKNKLDPKISPKFPFNKNIKTTNYSLQTTNSRCLVGIGGGKDSIVAAELLKQNGFDITAFAVETNKESLLVNKIIETIGIGDIKIQRFLDWQVHQQHQYNGHIPISSMYAFLGVFAAVLYKYSYVIVGNEYSSNFGNMKYKDQEINHQWSKSFEFEKLFQDYVKNFISQDIFYFSLLRPFYEIRTVKMFAKLEKYFPYFSSCNSNFKLSGESGGLWPASNPPTSKEVVAGSFAGWCGQCPKCVFVFTLLSAYVSKKELINIFGKNLYEDEKLMPLFRDVLGFGNAKPFDCVGTFEEAQTAFHIALTKNKSFIACPVVKALLSTTGVRSRRSLTANAEDPRMPIKSASGQIGGRVKYHPEVFKTQKENLVPEQFKFLGMENVLILGYGKEGKVTKKYLKKYCPNLKIGIADEKGGRDYLKNQENFDIAIKTPGIQKELLTIPYTTATNIFFSGVLGKHTIVGVTGSKGKSTTSSLIYAILKAAEKNVVLLGNIGKPMLEYLVNPIKKDAIFVLELSSYQLDDIKFSPDIAVVTNLFPEHMDFHGGVKNYYEAKKNIINFQSKDNYFVYDPHNKEMRQWLKNYQSTAVPFSKNIYESNLLGQHNKNNIQAAISTVKILGVSDAIIKKAVKNFKPLPHRLEFIGEFKGIKFYDDAISTTPESTMMAIKSLKNIGTIFLGGQDRGYDFLQLEKTIKKYRIKNVVLFPDSGGKMLKSIKGLRVLKTRSMKKAVKFAYQNTKKGSVCLLSCANPSYSLWKNFEEKGNQFQSVVKKMAK